ncbi:hypothetical protein LPJ56_006367, partial [Coemansia sp. RSA 2599]
HREGVEAAVRVGAAHPSMNNKPGVYGSSGRPAGIAAASGSPAGTARPSVVQSRNHASNSADDQDSMPLSVLAQQQQQRQRAMSPPAAQSSSMDVDSVHSSRPATSPDASPAVSKEKNREDVAKAAEFLGTPIKRFVHGYIVLDEFGKEMAATALALHSLELDSTMEKTVYCGQPTGGRSTGDLEEYADLLEYYDPEEKAYRKAVVLKESLKSNIIDLGSGRLS